MFISCSWYMSTVDHVSAHHNHLETWVDRDTFSTHDSMIAEGEEGNTANCTKGPNAYAHISLAKASHVAMPNFTGCTEVWSYRVLPGELKYLCMALGTTLLSLATWSDVFVSHADLGRPPWLSTLLAPSVLIRPQLQGENRPGWGNQTTASCQRKELIIHARSVSSY